MARSATAALAIGSSPSAPHAPTSMPLSRMTWIQLGCVQSSVPTSSTWTAIHVKCDAFNSAASVGASGKFIGLSMKMPTPLKTSAGAFARAVPTDAKRAATKAATSTTRRVMPRPDSRTESASCEVRLPLLEERLQPLLGILGRAREEERAPLELHAGGERRLERLVDGLFRQPDSDRPLR